MDSCHAQPKGLCPTESPFGCVLRPSCKASGLESRTSSYIFLGSPAIQYQGQRAQAIGGSSLISGQDGLFCTVEQKAKADGFPKPHEKAIVLEKPVLGISRSQSRKMVWDLGAGSFFAHRVFCLFALILFCSQQKISIQLRLPLNSLFPDPQVLGYTKVFLQDI